MKTAVLILCVALLTASNLAADFRESASGTWSKAAAFKGMPAAARPALSRRNIGQLIPAISECDAAKKSYVTLKEKADEKMALCRQAERAKQMRDIENSIGIRLDGMLAEPALSEGGNPACVDLIQSYRDVSESMRTAIEREYQSKLEACLDGNSDLPSIPEAQKKVCDACGGWPADLLTSDTDASFFHCPTEAQKFVPGE